MSHTPSDSTTEHGYYFALIVLSIGISLIEWFSGSQSLRTLSLHMVFHVIFFVALWITAGRVVVVKKNWSGVLLVILGAFTAYRVWDMVTAADTALNNVFLFVSVLLLISQSVLLHHVKNKQCSVLCHLSQIHISGDIIAIICIGLAEKIFSSVWTHRIDIIISSLVIAYMWVLFIRYALREKHGH